MTPLPELDAVIHAPARLRITATLAALADGDDLSFTRLQELLELTAGNLTTHLRKLEDAHYVERVKTRSESSATTRLRLTHEGRAALDQYTTTLRAWLDVR